VIRKLIQEHGLNFAGIRALFAQLPCWKIKSCSETEPASARVERFLAGRRPQLIWEMERDLFMAGDQKNAALRMLAHIEKYISHEDSLRWIAEIEALAKGEPLPPPPGAEGDQEAAS